MDDIQKILSLTICELTWFSDCLVGLVHITSELTWFPPTLWDTVNYVSIIEPVDKGLVGRKSTKAYSNQLGLYQMGWKLISKIEGLIPRRKNWSTSIALIFSVVLFFWNL